MTEEENYRIKKVKFNIHVSYPRVIIKKIGGNTDKEILEKANTYLENLMFEYPDYDARISFYEEPVKITCSKCGKKRIEYISGLCRRCHFSIS